MLSKNVVSRLVASMPKTASRHEPLQSAQLMGRALRRPEGKSCSASHPPCVAEKRNLFRLRQKIVAGT